jgi:steroid delta-isomerase-like uncharacterized protein
MSRKQIENLFARRDRAMNLRDAAATAAVYAEDAVVESPTAGGTVTGRKANEDVYRAWFTGFPDVTYTARALVIDGDNAVSIGETRGTDTGGFMGLPPTNKPFHLSIVFVCTVRDGFIAHEKRIYDFTGMLIQIGVLKARPI